MATHEIKFGTYDLTDIVEEWNEVSNSRLNLQLVPKRHGGLVSEVPVYDPRRIRMTGRIMKDTKEEVRTQIREIEGLQNVSDKLRIFDDRYFSAYLQGFGWNYVPGSALLVATFTLDFVCTDPFEYANSESSLVVTLTTSDTLVSAGIYKKSFTMTNGGSAFQFFKSVCAANQGSDVVQSIVRNNTISRFNKYTGTVVQPNELVTENALFTVKNNGLDDLVNWSGHFLHLAAGSNSMEVEGTVAQYTFTWTDRYS